MIIHTMPFSFIKMLLFCEADPWVNLEGGTNLPGQGMNKLKAEK